MGRPDHRGATAASRLVSEQGWANELFYEEGDVVLCRPHSAADVIATSAVAAAQAEYVGGHAHKCDSLPTQLVRLCLVCERVSRDSRHFCGRALTSSDASSRVVTPASHYSIGASLEVIQTAALMTRRARHVPATAPQ
eukprot:COSAG01_NODE_4750_length_4766_cov_16.850043_5_plen_138_part_00